MVVITDVFQTAQPCVREAGACGVVCNDCHRSKQKCTPAAKVIDAIIVGDVPATPHSVGSSVTCPRPESVSTLLAPGTKRHRSRSSLGVLKDIANAVRQLGSDERFKTLESRLAALEVKVGRLAESLEAKLKKGKGKGPLLPPGWSEDSDEGGDASGEDEEGSDEVMADAS